MPEHDPYHDWLEEFNREVDQALTDSETTESSRAPIARAMTDFESWWRHQDTDLEQEAQPAMEGSRINKELEFARRELSLLKEELKNLHGGGGEALAPAPDERVRELAQDKARLTEKNRRIEHENEELRRHDANVQTQIADLRIKTSKIRDDYENQIRRLEDKSRGLKEQIRSLQENKQFIQVEYAKQTERLAEFEGGLKDAYETKSQFESTNLELQNRIDTLESRLKEDAEGRAELQGALSELRNQAGGLQEKLVHNREAVDAQLAETRAISADVSRQSDAAERRLISQQSEAEGRMRETTRYLEIKLREMQSENKDRLSEFHEVLNALSRLRTRREDDA